MTACWCRADGRILFHNAAGASCSDSDEVPLQFLSNWQAWLEQAGGAGPRSIRAELDPIAKSSTASAPSTRRSMPGGNVRFLEFAVRRLPGRGGKRDPGSSSCAMYGRRQLNHLRGNRCLRRIHPNAEMLNLIGRGRQVPSPTRRFCCMANPGGKQLLRAADPRAEQPRALPAGGVNCARFPSPDGVGVLRPRARRFTRPIDNRDGSSRANHGTLFLDEIAIFRSSSGEAAQRAGGNSALPLGSNDTVRVDTRIISASNIDLRHAVDIGTFRPELYYRLAVIRCAFRRCADRIGDIPGW